MDLLLNLLAGGAGNLAAYLAAHVLLCLVPAFFIAGAMSALVPKQTITRLLGRNTPRDVLLPGRRPRRIAAGGLLLHDRSAFRGHLHEGRGSRAGHHLPLLRAGRQHPGSDLHRRRDRAPTSRIARLVLSLAFGIGIGMIMALIFRRDDAAHDAQTDALFAGRCPRRARAPLVFLCSGGAAPCSAR